MTKVVDGIPRHAFKVFFCCAVFTAIACAGSIVAFVVLMPDNEHGRRGILTALRAFSPGVFLGAPIAGMSYRVLLARRTVVDRA